MLSNRKARNFTSYRFKKDNLFENLHQVHGEHPL